MKKKNCEEENRISFVAAYLYQYRFIALMFAVFTIVFVLIFALYNIEIEAVLYAVLWCVLITAVVLSIHFLIYRRKYGQLNGLRKQILYRMEEFPPASNAIEQEYQEIVKKLEEAYKKSVIDRNRERKESKDYYAAWVHQIKTPIAAMGMLLQCEDTEAYRELSSELFKIEQYVEMVLAYQRLESESSDFVFKTYDLDSIIRQAIRKYAPQFVRKRLKISYEETDVQVLTDEKWLLLILEQILSNAIKYTQEGVVTIKVTEEKQLVISDTGIGIAAEDLPRIFEKGFTGYNGRMEKKSTGLGLYLCKSAAKKLHHEVSVSSVVGEGTTFCIDLQREELEVE